MSQDPQGAPFESSASNDISDKDAKCYDAELSARLPDETRAIFLQYSGIPEDKLHEHLVTVVGPTLSALTVVGFDHSG